MIYGEVGRLADESLRLGLRQAETAVLLGVAAHCAWLEFWLEAHRAAAAARRAGRDRQARTRRLVQRGVPPAEAARDLHIV